VIHNRNRHHHRDDEKTKIDKDPFFVAKVPQEGAKQVEHDVQADEQGEI
jgi:hypothetical protein